MDDFVCLRFCLLVCLFFAHARGKRPNSTTGAAWGGEKGTGTQRDGLQEGASTEK